VTVFDFRGKHVGKRHLRALRQAAADSEVVLDCTGATFVAAFEISDATLVGANFSGAVFERGARFERVEFKEDAIFDRARGSELSFRDGTFKGLSALRGIKVVNLVLRDTCFERYASFDEAALRQATFRDVTFAAEARFRQVQCSGPITMRSVRFGGPASFHASTVQHLSCPGCRFEGPLQSDELSAEKGLHFVGSRFEDTRFLTLDAKESVSLREASFAQSVVLSVGSEKFDADGACFERGVDLMLAPESCGRFQGTSFFGPTLITTLDAGDRPRAKVVTLDRSRVDHLTLKELDLSECSFAQLHRLDDVLIAGRGQLGLAPPVIEGSYRREVLADEAARRANEPGGMLGWAPVPWRRPAALEGTSRLGAQEIAEMYRAMRKSREDSNDYPGASDFYYGEMEMRREGAATWIERAILTVYWLVSGYGLRAGRTAIAFILMVLLLALGFQAIGLEDPPSFSHTFAWTFTASISLTRSVERLDMTTAGAYLNVAARVLGPALIALIVLGLRSRVRR